MARKAKAAPTKAGIEFYTDADSKWRWRLRSANGNIVASSGEGYNRISGARNGADAMVKAVKDLPIEVGQPLRPPVKKPTKPPANPPPPVDNTAGSPPPSTSLE